MADERSASICIVGWYGLDSTGDEAILSQFIREMLVGTSTHLTIIAANKRRAYALYASPNVTVLEHRRCFGRGALINVLRGRIFAQFKAVLRSDLLVVGGGSLLHDRGRIRNLMMILDEIWVAKLFGRRVAIFAIGVGPLRRRLARWLVAKTVRLCDLIMVRDQGSKQLLTEIGVPSERITVVADPAFLLRPIPVVEERAPWPKTSARGQDRVVGVFLLDTLDISPQAKRALINGLAAALDELHEKFGLNYVMIPFLTQEHDDDRVIAREVVGAMKNPAAAQVIEYGFEPNEMLWIASQFHLNITMRFHALLFSLASAVPAVAFDYDPKVANLMREFQLSQYLMPLEPLLIAHLVNAVRLAHENRAEYVRQIMRELPRRTTMARESFRLMRELIGVSGSKQAEVQPVN